MPCYDVLAQVCDLVKEVPLIEFQGAVKARVYKCNTPTGEKCFRVDPEVPEEGYDEHVYEVERS